MKNNNESNWELFKQELLNTKREGIDKLIEWLDSSDMKTAPASTRYHGNYEGGLLQHSLNVLKMARHQTSLIELFNVSDETLVITALLHDMCKVNYYKEEIAWKKNDNNQWESYTRYGVEDYFPIGHGEKSIILAQRFISLTDVEVAMIRNHMSFARDEINEVSRLFSIFPESLIISQADMMATYIIESDDLLEEHRNKLESKDWFGIPTKPVRKPRKTTKKEEIAK